MITFPRGQSVEYVSWRAFNIKLPLVESCFGVEHRATYNLGQC